MKPLSRHDPLVIGEFRLHSRLGSGGMGQVYLGFSRAGRAVAVKVVHAFIADDEEFLERFRREVAAASKVSGLYAAAVVASGVTDSPPWLATAYVPGPSLAVLVDQSGPLPEEAVWRLAAGLAEALRHVHDAGLVHRDLKPSNVLIADDGPHVIDFGISRAFEGTELTSAGMLIGTPGYMSPEQARSEPASPASDVFALGSVLAFAATGQPPFGTGDHSSVLYRVVTSEPGLGGVPRSLRRVIQACLAKDPAQRPSLDELADMIAAAWPPAAPSLGSFWPEPVARAIADLSASVTPDTPLPSAVTPDPRTPDPRTPVAPSPTETATPVRAPSWLREADLAVPRTVATAIGLMGVGFLVTVADLVLSLMVLGRYNGEVAQDRAAGLTVAQHAANQMAGAMAIGVAADAVGLIGWAWLALASRRGAGWTRTAGTALLAIYTACALIVGLATHGDPGPVTVTIVVWAIGLAASAATWSPSASVFFARWRRP